MYYIKFKLILLISLIISSSSSLNSQEFSDEFESLLSNDKPSLLPEKMLITQRVLWGEKGLFRKTGISKLNIENREKELIVREKMLKAHQIIGYITFAGMIYQGILGGKMYYSGDYSVYRTHKTLGKIVTASYFTGAGLSLFTPPPLVSRERKGLNNIRLHKILANVHIPAMIVTNIYSDKQHDDNKYREIHKISAYTAVASYSFAMISIMLNF
tara:strand:- start:3189 stop:3830 length:642 start_codon:yes stop_codon:yes gene_type:complete